MGVVNGAMLKPSQISNQKMPIICQQHKQQEALQIMNNSEFGNWLATITNFMETKFTHFFEEENNNNNHQRYCHSTPNNEPCQLSWKDLDMISTVPQLFQQSCLDPQDLILSIRCVKPQYNPGEFPIHHYQLSMPTCIQQQPECSHELFRDIIIQQSSSNNNNNSTKSNCQIVGIQSRKNSNVVLPSSSTLSRSPQLSTTTATNLLFNDFNGDITNEQQTQQIFRRLQRPDSVDAVCWGDTMELYNSNLFVFERDYFENQVNSVPFGQYCEVTPGTLETECEIDGRDFEHFIFEACFAKFGQYLERNYTIICTGPQMNTLTVNGYNDPTCVSERSCDKGDHFGILSWELQDVMDEYETQGWSDCELQKLVSTDFVPTAAPSLSQIPTSSPMPTIPPTTSIAPSAKPTGIPTASPSLSLSPTVTDVPTSIPSAKPSPLPTVEQTLISPDCLDMSSDLSQQQNIFNERESIRQQFENTPLMTDFCQYIQQPEESNGFISNITCNFDFGQNTNHGLEVACEAAGGDYISASYRANCFGPQGTSELFINNFQSCVGEVCTDAELDAYMLLEAQQFVDSFFLDPTLVNIVDHEKCELDQLQIDRSFTDPDLTDYASLCEERSEELWKINSIKDERAYIKTQFATISMDDACTTNNDEIKCLVNYRTEFGTTLQPTCLTQGGQYVELTHSITCTKDGEYLFFDSFNVPNCVASVCRQEDADKLIANEFKFLADGYENDGWDCTASTEDSDSYNFQGVPGFPYDIPSSPLCAQSNNQVYQRDRTVMSELILNVRGQRQEFQQSLFCSSVSDKETNCRVEYNTFTNNIQIPCEVAGGDYVEGTYRVDCKGKGQNSDKRLIGILLDVPGCVGMACSVDDHVELLQAEPFQFRDVMEADGIFKCDVSNLRIRTVDRLATFVPSASPSAATQAMTLSPKPTSFVPDLILSTPEPTPGSTSSRAIADNTAQPTTTFVPTIGEGGDDTKLREYLLAGWLYGATAFIIGIVLLFWE